MFCVAETETRSALRHEFLSFPLMERKNNALIEIINMTPGWMNDNQIRKKLVHLQAEALSSSTGNQF